MHTFQGRTVVPAVLSVVVSALALAGCESLAVASFGVGASTAVGQTLNGITYRTFTAPMPAVKGASVQALNRMGINNKSFKKTETGEVILAQAGKREIEVELEALTSNATRMRVIARDGGIFYDSSTATEIILQTEKFLNGGRA